jgi:CHAP domain-containing protein
VRRLVTLVILVLVVAGVVVIATPTLNPFRGPSAAEIAKEDVAAARAISPLRGRIVQIAESQVGYSTDPSNTYCNKYSAYWVSGTATCGNSNRAEEWCADFAAWVWQSAGAEVVYQFINGDLNSSSASFYEWGVAQGTWHPVGSGYVPEPGDVAVYGLNESQLVAQHVAVVVSDTPGEKGPDVVNGDGDRTGFSVVEVGNNEYKADAPGTTAYLSGYVSPSETS